MRCNAKLCRPRVTGPSAGPAAHSVWRTTEHGINCKCHTRGRSTTAAARALELDEDSKVHAQGYDTAHSAPGPLDVLSTTDKTILWSQHDRYHGSLESRGRAHAVRQPRPTHFNCSQANQTSRTHLATAAAPAIFARYRRAASPRCPNGVSAAAAKNWKRNSS